MAEVYDISTGCRVNRTVESKKVRKIAKENDRFRKRFSWKTDMIPSVGFMGLKRDVLTQVLYQLKRSRYSRIDFGGLSGDVISKTEKDLAAQEHSAGIIHVGKPIHHVVWRINTTKRKLEVCLGSEYFGTNPKHI